MAGDKTITYNTSTGSNTLASGCGPATAITGTGAISGDGAGGGTQTVIDLSADTPDLSGVVVGDILFIATGVASDRWLFEISAVDDTADTVTVTDAPTTAINTGSALSWAIGGVRENPFGLYSNTSFGDLYWGHARGWTFELTGGQTFDSSTSCETWPSSTSTDPIQVKSTSSTRATITMTTLFRNFANIAWRGIDFNLGGLNTGSGIFSPQNCTFYDCKFRNNSGNNVYLQKSGVLTNCIFDGVGSTISTKDALYFDDRRTYSIVGCTFINSGGIRWRRAYRTHTTIANCVFVSPAEYGLEFSLNATTVNNQDWISQNTIINNTFYDATTHGISIIGGPTAGRLAAELLLVQNNIFANCGGYGISFNSTNHANYPTNLFLNNLFYSNTSGNYSISGFSGIGDVTGDPLFTSTTIGSEDLTLGTGSPAIDAGLEAPPPV